ncbi:helix-turn-helix transcriptional regulator [Actinoplanes sp. TBRC 11911]|uniref:helix-turn-helix domain-containing protein n=1 Tax=Actinoplanes sp. TBRC 11911 TaxID=2729386 RepID=UPI00145F66AD|nr:helix-turn-helix transcriptional regulator [Actinoplanes sp. TBRC 11911]NMO57774.1 helix-turn-helix transcriptional regulator [Actinoplanes sp. TBRC 11911]
MRPETEQDHPISKLALRLKELRHEAGVTQGSVASHLGVKGPMVSGYENGKEIPIDEKVRRYAELFRNTERGRDELEVELLNLRTAAKEAKSRSAAAAPRPRASFWHFPDGNDVTLVCGELPTEMRMPYAQPKVPDYVRTYRYADPDTLLELWGHLPGANPGSRVRHITSDEYDPTVHDTDHLVVLGGVDFNKVTERILADIDFPITQEHFPSYQRATSQNSERSQPSGPESPQRAAFVVNHGSEDEQNFEPVLEQVEAGWELAVDIGLIVRGPNPYNASATLTMFNGMYGRGVLGSALALTHRQLRERNTRYLTNLGCDRRIVAILFKVQIMNEKPSPPDLTNPAVRLFQWEGPSVTG